jgi:hypothetical protein
MFPQVMSGVIIHLRAGIACVSQLWDFIRCGRIKINVSQIKFLGKMMNLRKNVFKMEPFGFREKNGDSLTVRQVYAHPVMPDTPEQPENCKLNKVLTMFKLF